MEAPIIRQLLDLNYQFYQTFAASFAATRQQLQPGVRRLLAQLDPDANVLDLGCGNGEVWRQLIRQGHRGRYIGADFSPALLEKAAQVQPSPQAIFLPLDLADPDWPASLPRVPCDAVLAFAVFHHLPGRELRLRTLRQIHDLLRHSQATSGHPAQLLFSVWQVESWPKFSTRVQPWEKISLQPSQLEPGDYLIDWRFGGQGLRYVHHFTLAELEELAAQTGFVVRLSFRSDGKTGNLGLYQVWELV